MRIGRISSNQMHTIRAWVTWAIRAVALILLATGSYLMLKRIAFGIGVKSAEAALGSWTGVGEEHSFYRGIGMVFVGIVLAGFSKALARWVVTMPTRGCPNCGYAVSEGVGESERCPECGLELDTEKA